MQVEIICLFGESNSVDDWGYLADSMIIRTTRKADKESWRELNKLKSKAPTKASPFRKLKGSKFTNSFAPKHSSIRQKQSSLSAKNHGDVSSHAMQNYIPPNFH